MSEYQVIAPRLGTNDNYVNIGEWLVSSGSKISKGDELVQIETTKKTEIIEAEEEGYFYYKIEEGEDVEVGEVLGIITDNSEFKFTKIESPIDDYSITNKAKELILKYDVDLSHFDKDTIIREKDVMKFISNNFSVQRSKSNDIIIFGGGGLCKMIIDLIKLNKAYNIHGIIDDYQEVGTKILDVPVIGNSSMLSSLREEGYMTAISAIGSIAPDNKGDLFNARKKICKQLKMAGFYMPTLIHPSAQIAGSAVLGEGVIVMENAVIGADAMIGDDALINTGAIVSHDCLIGNHSRISPGAVLAGNVKVGENALVGMGSTLYIGINVGENAIITNGQNVFRNVKEYETI